MSNLEPNRVADAQREEDSLGSGGARRIELMRRLMLGNRLMIVWRRVAPELPPTSTRISTAPAAVADAGTLLFFLPFKINENKFSLINSFSIIFFYNFFYNSSIQTHLILKMNDLTFGKTKVNFPQELRFKL